jgi:hypothetical protein
MRFLTALATIVAVLVSVSCEGNSAATEPAACTGLPRPGVPLAFAPAQPPSRATARCLSAQYTAVIGPQSWGNLPSVIRKPDPGLAAWQERSLLYACNGCGLAGFGLAWVRDHHPSWILHSAQGTEIHPQEHPGWVLLDFADPKYQSAWALHVRKSLAAGGWTGVNVIDADNDPDWSDTPIDPATGSLMTEARRRRHLADALALIRATLKIQGFSLLADNGPPSVIDFFQVNSTDAVSLRDGFARVSGPDWNTLLRYFRHASGEGVGTYVGDRPRLTRAQEIYGLASFLLVAIPRDSAYVAPAGASSPVYAIDPGTVPTTPATADGPVWTRTYPNATVAVNPSDFAATVTLGSAGPVTLGPRSAAIEASGHLVTSG